MRAIKKAPLTFRVLDLWPDTLQAIGVARSKSMLQFIGKLVSGIYRHCDLILAQSKSFIPQIAKYAGERSRIEYLPGWSESVFEMQHVFPAPEVPLKIAAGIPVLALLNGEGAELVQNARAGLACPAGDQPVRFTATPRCTLSLRATGEA